MDRRSWPWKKKATTNAAEKPATNVIENSVPASDNHAHKPVKEEKRPKNVQISMESYIHLTGLENQVKSYEEEVHRLEDEINELSERLSEANSEITNKDNLVKQHTKVAEEAVSGWEKAEEEAAALKNHLESVTMLKLTAEERASHLDGALKECMRQIRNLKDEHDQKLQEVSLSKAKMFDKMKLELEGKLFTLDQELLRAASENAALSRSLEERSSMLTQLHGEKSRAHAQIELLHSKIESYEKEMNSLKYEVHIARKEAEICSEEKSISVRSAEVANKNYLESVKKIAKLEAECQRLRVLVRKKLPGPAAIAQMKLEVDNVGRDYGEPRFRRSPGRSPSPHSSHSPEFSFEISQKYIKENEMLTDRLMAMEEEIKMLKDELAKRDSELQSSQSIYTITASKLQSLEADHLSLRKSTQIQNESVFNKKFNKLEEGIDDNVSSDASWSAGLLSEHTYAKRLKNVEMSPGITEDLGTRDLMDDFLEMEKLAYSVIESNSMFSDVDVRLPAQKTEGSVEGASSSSGISHLHVDSCLSAELKSLLSSVVKAMNNDNNQKSTVENAKRFIKNMCDCLLLQPEKLAMDASNSTTEQELKAAASRICEFILILGREAKLDPDASHFGASLHAQINRIVDKYMGTVDGDINPDDFVVDISNVFSEASKLHFNVLGSRRSESETSSDCIDKVALPESKAVLDSPGDKCHPISSGNCSDSCSDPDVTHYGSLVPTAESSIMAWKRSREEFEQMKMDRDTMAADLARHMENLENTKMQLQETELVLAEVKSQLSSAQKSNGLADTQLKCMAESYKSLETRAQDLQSEVNRLQGRIENLENELQEARTSIFEADNRCKNLQDQLDKVDASKESCIDEKASQEKELAAAAEKLAECQETIYLLDKQLRALRSQPEIASSLDNTRTLRGDTHVEESNTSGTNMKDTAACFDVDTDTCLQFQRIGLESPLLDVSNPLFSPDYETDKMMRSPISSNQPKHRQSKSCSSSSVTPTPEKQARGFIRFFSSSTKAGKLNQ